jgi:Transposase DDE domain/DNA methylase
MYATTPRIGGRGLRQESARNPNRTEKFLNTPREFLTEDGSIWVSLDDAEAHYFKVMGDEIFGRRNFILDIAWQKDAMRAKLRTEGGRAVHKMRKAIVEPVFGQIKEQRGFRRFSLRGEQNVSREWKLVCAVSNLLKLFRAGEVLEMT